MNAPKSVEYREAVARIIDPEAWRGIDKFYESGGGRELYGSWERCLQHSANAPTSLAKADAILALSGPVSGMDTRPSNANPAATGPLPRIAAEAEPSAAFQARVLPWMLECFGPVIPFDREERGDRLLEEVFELLQSGGYDPARVLALRDYVWSRDVGEPAQEAGGVMVTMAAYCIAFGLDMATAGETELARIWTKVPQIRAKQAAKPTGSALPIAKAEATATEAQHAGQWRGIESAPRGVFAEDIRDPAWREPPLVLLLFEGGKQCVGKWDWYYAERGAGADETSGVGWIEALTCEPVTLHVGPPTHWMPAPPAAPPSPAPPSSEREGSRAGDRS